MASLVARLFLFAISIAALATASPANILQRNLDVEKIRNEVIRRYPQLENWAKQYHFPEFNLKDALNDFIESALSKLKWFQSPCPKGKSEKQAGLCYTPCRRPSWAFVKGVGPVCWGCPKSHPIEQAGLCYKRCPSHTPIAGVTFCYGHCPSGYRNDGATCFVDAHIYGADNSRCPWYDKCGLTFARGCTRCARGYNNDGCTCRRNPHLVWRPSYHRGVGIAMWSYGRGVGVVPEFYLAKWKN